MKVQLFLLAALEETKQKAVTLEQTVEYGIFTSIR